MMIAMPDIDGSFAAMLFLPRTGDHGMPWGFAELDVVRISASVFESNPASAHVLEKCGYELEGRLRRAVCKKGVLMDSFVYAILRETD